MEFDNDFFEDASQMWRLNKKYLGKGFFVYRCKYIHSNGKKCSKNTEHSSSNKNYMKVLYGWSEDWVGIKRKVSNNYCKQHKNRYKF